jgi:hypothetical protein
MQPSIRQVLSAPVCRIAGDPRCPAASAGCQSDKDMETKPLAVWNVARACGDASRSALLSAMNYFNH